MNELLHMVRVEQESGNLDIIPVLPGLWGTPQISIEIAHFSSESALLRTIEGVTLSIDEALALEAALRWAITRLRRERSIREEFLEQCTSGEEK